MGAAVCLLAVANAVTFTDYQDLRGIPQIRMSLDQAVKKLEKLKDKSGVISFHGTAIYHNSFRLYPKGKDTRAWLGITCANQAERAKLLQMILDASKGWQLFDEEERKKILAQQQADLFADFGYTRSPPAKPVSNADAPDSVSVLCDRGTC